MTVINLSWYLSFLFAVALAISSAITVAPVATMPKGLKCKPADWWRAFLVFAITTGWRLSEILGFRREDLDLESEAIVTRAENNKGKRDDLDYLPDIALEHVRQLVGFPTIFKAPALGD